MVKVEEHRKFTILIVEDDEISFLYLETLIGEQLLSGVTILHAKDGLQAIEICRANDDIDLVLMDLKMPNMNGFEAATQIRRLRPDLPTIAETGFSMNSDIENALQAGCNEVVIKPISMASMICVLSKYLHLEGLQKKTKNYEIR